MDDENSATIGNCTFSGNVAPHGAGLYNYSTPPTIINSILWGDTLAEIGDNRIEAPPIPVSYSTVKGSYEGVGNSNHSPLWLGNPLRIGSWTGTSYFPNLHQSTFTDSSASWDDDELVGMFIQPDTSNTAWYQIIDNTNTSVTVWGSGADTIELIDDTYLLYDVQLSAVSPCIDAANGDEAPETDLLGNERHDDPGTRNRGIGFRPYVDQGAYEALFETCLSHMDCVDDDVCGVFVYDPIENHIVQECTPPTGTFENGELCESGSECQTGICAELPDGSNRCAGPCDSVLQLGCTEGTTCYPNLLFWPFDQGTVLPFDDVYDSYSSCAPFFGSYDLCASDLDCPNDPIETCVTALNADRSGVDYRCVLAVGPGIAGAPCTVDADCRSNQCQESGICFGICDPSFPDPNPACFLGRTCANDTFVVDPRDPGNSSDDITAVIPVCQ